MSSIDPTPPSSRGSSVPRGPRGEGAWAGISSRLFSSGGSSVGGSVNSSNSSISMSSSSGGGGVGGSARANRGAASIGTSALNSMGMVGDSLPAPALADLSVWLKRNNNSNSSNNNSNSTGNHHINSNSSSIAEEEGRGGGGGSDGPAAWALRDLRELHKGVEQSAWMFGKEI